MKKNIEKLKGFFGEGKYTFTAGNVWKDGIIVHEDSTGRYRLYIEGKTMTTTLASIALMNKGEVCTRVINPKYNNNLFSAICEMREMGHAWSVIARRFSVDVENIQVGYGERRKVLFERIKKNGKKRKEVFEINKGPYVGYTAYGWDERYTIYIGADKNYITYQDHQDGDVFGVCNIFQFFSSILKLER